MTEPIANLFAQRLRTLPFADRVAGLVRPRQQLFPDPDGRGGKVERWPEPLDPAMPTCEASGAYLLPDPNTKSIFFFEDEGSVPIQLGPGVVGFESQLRLLGWLNPFWLSLPLTDARLVTALVGALRHPLPSGPYNSLQFDYRVLPADSSLWNKYTYQADLLLLPYQLVGLHLTCRYVLPPECLSDPLPDLLKERRDCTQYPDPTVPEFDTDEFNEKVYD